MWDGELVKWGRHFLTNHTDPGQIRATSTTWRYKIKTDPLAWKGLEDPEDKVWIRKVKGKDGNKEWEDSSSSQVYSWPSLGRPKGIE